MTLSRKKILKQVYPDPERIEKTPTPEMLQRRDEMLHTAEHFSASHQLGYCLYDPCRQEFTICHMHKDTLGLKSCCRNTETISIEKMLLYFTPVQQQYIRRFEQTGYQALMYMHERNISGFLATAVLQLKDKQEKPVTLVAKVNVAITYPDGSPWLTLITLNRAKHLDNEREEFYQLFSIQPLPPHIESNIPICELRRRLSDTELRFLCLQSQGLDRTTIINTMHIGKSTYDTHGENIRRELAINKLEKAMIFCKSITQN